MRQVLPALALGVALAGCAGGEVADSASPSTPSRGPQPTAAIAGPTTAGDVPLEAFLAPADLGPGWSPTAAAATPCAPAYARTAARSTGLTDQRGVLTETVATGVDVAATVSAWEKALSGCGSEVRDDALGDASLAALSADGADAVLVTGTEGVLVVLHAHGALARQTDELNGWADLALGTSCVAAPDGCH